MYPLSWFFKLVTASFMINWMFGLDWIKDILNSFTQFSSHSVHRCNKFICALFYSTKWEKEKILTDWINSTLQHASWGDFTRLWRETWAMFLTPIRSHTAVQGSPGVMSGPLDGQAGNCKPGRPGAHVLCLPRCFYKWCHHVVKRYSSLRPRPFVTIWEHEHRLSAWREIEVGDSVDEGQGDVGCCGAWCVQASKVDCWDL